MGIASAVTLFACIPPIIAKNYVGQSAWGLSAGLITVIVCAVLFKVFDEVSNQLLKVTTIILFIMWATVAGKSALVWFCHMNSCVQYEVLKT